MKSKAEAIEALDRGEFGDGFGRIRGRVNAQGEWDATSLINEAIEDALFGLEKLRNDRLNSGSAMAGVVSFWSWVLLPSWMDPDNYSNLHEFFEDALDRFRELKRAEHWPGTPHEMLHKRLEAVAATEKPAPMVPDAPGVWLFRGEPAEVRTRGSGLQVLAYPAVAEQAWEDVSAFRDECWGGLVIAGQSAAAAIAAADQAQAHAEVDRARHAMMTARAERDDALGQVEELRRKFERSEEQRRAAEAELARWELDIDKATRRIGKALGVSDLNALSLEQVVERVEALVQHSDGFMEIAGEAIGPSVHATPDEVVARAVAALRGWPAAMHTVTLPDRLKDFDEEAARIRKVVRRQRGALIPVDPLAGVVECIARSNHDDVAEFHRAAGQPLAAEPVTAPSRELLQLRVNLATEEQVSETLTALRCEVSIRRFKVYDGPSDTAGRLLTQIEISEPDPERFDLEAVADGLVDGNYINHGTAHALGIPWKRVWAEVQRANMDKFPVCAECDGDGCNTCYGLGRIVILDENGKIQKPDGWTGPAIHAAVWGESMHEIGHVPDSEGWWWVEAPVRGWTLVELVDPTGDGLQVATGGPALHQDLDCYTWGGKVSGPKTS